MFRRFVVLASTALITGALAGCGNTDSWVEAHAAAGWPAQYGDAANSSYSPTSPAPTRCGWSGRARSRATWPPQVALGSGSYLAVNAQTAGGCSLMVWETDNNARQRWCTRLWQGGGLSSPLFDGFDNLYVGQPGAMLSFPPTQWIRWRQPVIGMPTTPRILAPGQLLVVTHLGQVLVFDAHRGIVVGTRWIWWPASTRPTPPRDWPIASRRGARCPVAAAPAFSSADGHRGGQPVAPERAGAGPGRAALPRRPDPAAHP